MRKTLVAPYAGAWIEILARTPTKDRSLVAPYAGAWIEMFQYSICWSYCLVAPYAGAWIEIQKEQELTTQQLRRSLRGSVD